VTNPAEPYGFALTVDRAATAVELPDPDTPGVEVWHDLDGTTAAVGFQRQDEHYLHVPTVGTFRFGPHSAAVVLFPTPDVCEQSADDAYCRIVLPLASQLHGRQVLHASAVVISGGVIALCGRSGAGKSTLAYGLGQRGHPLWGDDAVAYEETDAGLLAHPLPFRLRLRPPSAEWFDDLPHLKGNERALPWSAGTQPRPFRAMFVLERGDAPDGVADVARLDPADAFSAVLPHGYYLALSDRRLSRSLLSAYLALADRLPVFRLRYVPQLELIDDIGAAVETAVATL